MTDKIVLVQPLHDNDDGAGTLVIEPAVEGVAEPFIGSLPLRVGQRLLRLQRIVNQNDVGAASSEHPAIAGGQPISLAGGEELLHGLPVWRQAGGKDSPIPWAQNDEAAIAGELVGELSGIADAQDLGRRIMPEAPCRERDRGQ
jgi:hypothetical protein